MPRRHDRPFLALRLLPVRKMFKDRSFLIRAFIIFSLALCLIITLFGFIVLLESPYTGLKLSPCNGRTCIDAVDADSPASAAGIKAGDLLVAVNGEEVPFFVFSRDPDWVRWREDRRAFRQWQRRLDRTVIKNKPLALTIRGSKDAGNASLTPARFPLARAFARSLPVYLGAWGAAVLALLVLRKRQNELSIVNFMVWVSICLNGVSLATYTVRDIAFSVDAMGVLSAFNHLGACFMVAALLHFIMVFPRRKKVTGDHPSTVKALYGAAALLFFLDVAEVFRDTYVFHQIPYVAGMAISVVWMVYDLVKEKDPILRKQSQWVVLGMTATGGAALILYVLPVMLGWPPLVLEAFVYPLAMLTSASFVFAITRYRLMDIENIFDTTVVYGVTILILQGAELAFLGAAGPYLNQGRRAPVTTMLGVLLIVFLYLPVRNAAKKKVEAFFKRGSYDADEELRKLVSGLGVCDYTLAIEKFTAYAKKLFAPSSLFVVKLSEGRVELVQAKHKSDRAETEKLATSASEARRYFEQHRHSILGYDLADRGVLKNAGDLESALFVPFYAANELVFLVVLHTKNNGTIYSRKDISLLDAISVQLTHILEAEERKRELENERLRLAREIHDGIGSEFTGIISFCEKGEQSAGQDEKRDLPAVFSSIAGSARRGIRELRNIVWALNPERQSLGYLSGYIKRYASDMLSADGLKFSMNESGDNDHVTLSPQVLLACFRIVQESCHNVLKHAGADRVTINMQASGGWLEFRIEDNGRGFDAAAALRGPGNGLKNLQKRAEEIGGTMEFMKSSMGGTLVRARLPMG